MVTQKSGDQLRVFQGESEAEAYNRIVKKLYDIGRPEDNHLGIPTPMIDMIGTGSDKDTGSTEQPSTKPSVTPSATQIQPTAASPGATVVSTPSPTPMLKRESRTCSSPASSPLNLMGRIEDWGVKPNTVVEKISLSVTDVTGAELKTILSKLPESVSYTLDVQIEQDSTDGHTPP